MKFNNNLFNWICLITLFIILLFAAFGCTTQKHITTETKTVDSSRIKEQEDLIRALTIENVRLTAEIHELQYAGVVFDTDTTTQHPIYIMEEGKDLDSLIELLNNYKNKVKIYADGTIEAEGKLKSAYYSKDKQSRFITELQRINDSLKVVKQKEVVRVVTDTKYVDRRVKRSWFTGWWLWLLMFAGGYYVRGRFGKIFGII